MPVKAAGQAKSYRYLRIAMAGLLAALAAAVFCQSIRQGSLLASVSACYYTPARSVFAGALIGLGASMIALQGMDNAEETFLDLGGISATVAAIVPTGRGADFDTAVLACQKAGRAFPHPASLEEPPLSHGAGLRACLETSLTRRDVEGLRLRCAS